MLLGITSEILQLCSFMSLYFLKAARPDNAALGNVSLYRQAGTLLGLAGKDRRSFGQE